MRCRRRVEQGADVLRPNHHWLSAARLFPRSGILTTKHLPTSPRRDSPPTSPPIDLPPTRNSEDILALFCRSEDGIYGGKRTLPSWSRDRSCVMTAPSIPDQFLSQPIRAQQANIHPAGRPVVSSWSRCPLRSLPSRHHLSTSQTGSNKPRIRAEAEVDSASQGGIRKEEPTSKVDSRRGRWYV